MARLTKRVVDGLRSDGAKHGTVFWDSELKGFGVRVFPTGLKTFVVKFRTRGGRQRWLKLGAFGALTVEQARDRARTELAKVLDGEDPADTREQQRAAVTLGQLCDDYLEAAEAGLVLGRKGVPKKMSTVVSDRCRVDAHIRPLLGKRKAADVTRADIKSSSATSCWARRPKTRSLARGAAQSSGAARA